jgi:hypothetical protein
MIEWKKNHPNDVFKSINRIVHKNSSFMPMIMNSGIERQIIQENGNKKKKLYLKMNWKKKLCAKDWECKLMWINLNIKHFSCIQGDFFSPIVMVKYDSLVSRSLDVEIEFFLHNYLSPWISQNHMRFFFLEWQMENNGKKWENYA